MLFVIAPGVLGVNADKVGIEAAEVLLANLRHGGTVDEYLQDQVTSTTLSGSKPSFLLGLNTIMLNTDFFNCGIKYTDTFVSFSWSQCKVFPV